MSPLPTNKIYQIDPTVKRLWYGEVPESNKKMCGRIIESNYSVPKRQMSYLIKFEDGFEGWFLESELI